MQKIQLGLTCCFIFKWGITIQAITIIQIICTLQLLVRIRWDNAWKAIIWVWDLGNSNISRYCTYENKRIKCLEWGNTSSPPLSLTCWRMFCFCLSRFFLFPALHDKTGRKRGREELESTSRNGTVKREGAGQADVRVQRAFWSSICLLCGAKYYKVQFASTYFSDITETIAWDQEHNRCSINRYWIMNEDMDHYGTSFGCVSL